MILQCEGRNIIVYGQVFGRFFFRKLRFFRQVPAEMCHFLRGKWADFALSELTNVIFGRIHKPHLPVKKKPPDCWAHKSLRYFPTPDDTFHLL